MVFVAGFVRASALALVVLLSGCAAGGTGQPRAATDGPPGPGAAVGAIQGTVTDPEINPLEGVRIRLVRSDGNDSEVAAPTTDEAGGFFVGDLEPGEYIVFAERPGYREPTPKPVEVTAGTITFVILLVERLRVQTPFHTSISYHLYLIQRNCILNPAFNLCSQQFGNFPNATFSVEVEESQNGFLETFVAELQWQSSVAACPAGMRQDVYSPGQFDYEGEPDAPENPNHWDSLPGTRSPTHLLIFREGTETAMHSASRTDLNGGRPIVTTGKWQIQTGAEDTGALGTPVDFDCHVDQDFVSWITVFHVAPAPSPEWSVFAEG